MVLVFGFFGFGFLVFGFFGLFGFFGFIGFWFFWFFWFRFFGFFGYNLFSQLSPTFFSSRFPRSSLLFFPLLLSSKVDDMIDTARTLVHAERLLHEHGARRVFAFASHGLFSGRAKQRIKYSDLEEVIVTNTVPVPYHCVRKKHSSRKALQRKNEEEEEEEKGRRREGRADESSSSLSDDDCLGGGGGREVEKVKVLSLAPLLAEAIRRVYLKQPLTNLQPHLKYEKEVLSRQYSRGSPNESGGSEEK